MIDSLPASEVDYHLERARSERDLAYRSGVSRAADAHMRLSVLHMDRALLLQTGHCSQTDDRYMMNEQNDLLKVQVALGW